MTELEKAINNANNNVLQAIEESITLHESIGGVVTAEINCTVHCPTCTQVMYRYQDNTLACINHKCEKFKVLYHLPRVILTPVPQNAKEQTNEHEKEPNV